MKSSPDLKSSVPAASPIPEKSAHIRVTAAKKKERKKNGDCRHRHDCTNNRKAINSSFFAVTERSYLLLSSFDALQQHLPFRMWPLPTSSRTTRKMAAMNPWPLHIVESSVYLFTYADICARYIYTYLFECMRALFDIHLKSNKASFPTGSQFEARLRDMLSALRQRKNFKNHDNG